MLKLLLITGCLILCVQSKAQNYKPFAQPESVNYDGRSFYVTNIGANPDPGAADGDGFITKVDRNGKVVLESITDEKLNAPKGTAVINNILYVADLERIVAIDLKTGKKVKEISLAQYNTRFTNDITVKNNHTLFVSATDTGSILEVNLNTGKTFEAAKLKGVNGIFYDKKSNILYACSFIFEDPQAGQIQEIKWVKGKAVYNRVGNFKGAFDGIWLLDQNTLLVSNWAALDHPAGYVEKIDLKSKTSKKMDLPLMHGPADFYVDMPHKQIFIPVVMEGKLIITTY